VRTTYLGQYTDEHANEIAGLLEDAGIAWYYKQAWGPFRVLFLGDWGTRLFVDEARLDEARELAKRVVPEVK
jgi:hypothetical protein